MALKNILTTVRSRIQTNLGVDDSVVDITKDERPHPYAGEIFYAIYGQTKISSELIGHEALMEEFEFSVAITIRDNVVPTDEHGEMTLYNQNPSSVNLQGPLEEKMREIVSEVIANKNTYLGLFNTSIQADNAGASCIISVPRLLNMEMPRVVGPAHFWSMDQDHPIDDQTKGFVGILTFGGLQRPHIDSNYV